MCHLIDQKVLVSLPLSHWWNTNQPFHLHSLRWSLANERWRIYWTSWHSASISNWNRPASELIFDLCFSYRNFTIIQIWRICSPHSLLDKQRLPVVEVSRDLWSFDADWDIDLWSLAWFLEWSLISAEGRWSFHGPSGDAHWGVVEEASIQGWTRGWNAGDNFSCGYPNLFVWYFENMIII